MPRRWTCLLFLALLASPTWADPVPVRDYLSQAEVVASQIGLSGDQSAARRDIALTLSRIEASEALRAAAGISRPSDAARVLGAIAAAQAKTEPAAAQQAAATGSRLLLRLADPVRRAREQALYLAEIAPLGSEAPALLTELRPEEARTIVVISLAESQPELAWELAKTWQLSGPLADQALAALAPSLSLSQPEAARELATKITSPELRDFTLWRVAERQPLTEATAVIPLLQDPITRDGVLASTALRLNQTDPEAALAAVDAITVSPASVRAQLAVDLVLREEARAAELARQLPPPARSWALGHMALALASVKPEQAEAYLHESGTGAETVRLVATRLAHADPTRALRLARMALEGEEREATLAAIAVTLAPRNLAQAREIARELQVPRWRAEAVGAVARALAENDSDAATSLLGMISDPEDLLPIRAQVAAVIARRDAATAQRLLETTPQTSYRSASAFAAARAQLTSSRAPDAAISLAAVGMDRGLAIRWLLPEIARTGTASPSALAEKIEPPYLRVLALVDTSRALLGDAPAARPAPERTRMIRTLVEWEERP